jgi:hypothetical protein
MKHYPRPRPQPTSEEFLALNRKQAPIQRQVLQGPSSSGSTTTGSADTIGRKPLGRGLSSRC